MKTYRDLLQLLVFIACFAFLPVQVASADEELPPPADFDLENPTEALNALVRQFTGYIVAEVRSNGTFQPMAAVLDNTGKTSLVTISKEDLSQEQHYDLLDTYHQSFVKTVLGNPSVIATVFAWPDRFVNQATGEQTLTIQIDCDHKDLEPKLIMIPYYIDKKNNRVVVRMNHVEYAKGMMRVFPPKGEKGSKEEQTGEKSTKE